MEIIRSKKELGKGYKKGDYCVINEFGGLKIKEPLLKPFYLPDNTKILIQTDQPDKIGWAGYKGSQRWISFKEYEKKENIIYELDYFLKQLTNEEKDFELEIETSLFSFDNYIKKMRPYTKNKLFSLDVFSEWKIKELPSIIEGYYITTDNQKYSGWKELYNNYIFFLDKKIAEKHCLFLNRIWGKHCLNSKWTIKKAYMDKTQIKGILQYLNYWEEKRKFSNVVICSIVCF